MPPLVSVVISSYQSADTLPRAINSVLSQGFNDFELIIVDNGSTDDTQEVIKNAQSLDSRVRNLQLPVNQKPSGGRNAGVDKAQGSLIAFLDADDEWLPDKLALEVRLLGEYPDYAMVFTDSWNINININQHELLSARNNLFLQQLSFTPVPDEKNIYFVSGPVSQSIYSKSFINMSTALIRKTNFLSIGGFDLKRFGTEDIDFWMRLSKFSRFIYYHQPTVNRYQSTDGTSSSGERWLKELVNYHQMCLKSSDYDDLQGLARQNLKKAYRNLIIYYGEHYSRANVIITYGQSLELGVDMRIFLDMCIALTGTIPLFLLRKLQYAKIKVTSNHTKDFFHDE